jgi:hypothetical protein
LKYESNFHTKTWYSTPSISCRDYEVFVDSKEIKTQSKPDLRKDHMKRHILGLEDRCHELRRLDHSLDTSRRHQISWEDSLVLVTEEEARQKDWDMNVSLIPEGNLVVTSNIDLPDQACCR